MRNPEAESPRRSDGRKPNRQERTSRARVRDAQALELRSLGYSYPAIASALGISLSTAHAAVQRAIAEWVAVPVETVVEQECFKLAQLEQRWWPLALEGDLEAFNAVMKVMERRAKLLGLDAPQRFDVRALVAEWARENGLDPEATVAVVTDGPAPLLPVR